MMPTPRPTPPINLEAATRRWRNALSHVVASGGLVVAVETVPGATLMSTSDGDLIEHPHQQGQGSAIAQFQSWLAEHIEEFAHGRLVALCTTFPNWAGQPVSQVAATAPNIVLPLRVAPEEMQQALAAKRAEIAARPPVEGVVEVGTDASVHLERYGGTTWAWVDSLGVYRTYKSPAQLSVYVAETLAILDAIHHHDRRIELLVHTDSLNSQRAFAQLLGGEISGADFVADLGLPYGSSALRRQALIATRDIAERPVRVQWVKGHAGHPLNEAAHRLATLARRVAVTGCAERTYRSMCEGIVEEMQEQI